MANTHTVAVAARMISEETGKAIAPRTLTDLFYKRALDVNRCPIVGDRRMIPCDYVPQIIEVLKKRGLVPETSTGEPR
jgi:hypothetical protein